MSLPSSTRAPGSTAAHFIAARAAVALCALLGGLGAACSAAAGTTGAAGQGGSAGATTGSGAAGAGGQGGDDGLFGTSPECQKAGELQTSVGCDYYAVDMDGLYAADNGCFVAFVANTSDKAAALKVTFGDKVIDLASYAKVPIGAGKKLAYGPYNTVSGLDPGAVAILFLAGGYAMDPNDKPDPATPVKCPVPAAIPQGAQRHGTGRGLGFHIQSSVPVVAYQMLPYGGGAAAVTGASLLLPTTAWDTRHVLVSAYSALLPEFNVGPSVSLIARDDATSVTIVPKNPIGAGPDVTGAPAGEPVTYVLGKGQVLQLTQGKELTGSPVTSDKPIGLFAGHQCTNTPANIPYCDHAEQQIPSVRSLGNEYVAVTHRQRNSKAESPPWRLVGAADGTQLTYEPDVGGPATLNLGDDIEFSTSTPFVVKSQDKDHPFLLLGYMTGAESVNTGKEADDGYGDPDVVRMVPPAQYLSRYVFFTDPTYPETDLVVVRKKGPNGFADVTLDCAGPLAGWAPIGSGGLFEYTRTDLVRHDFEPQGSCDNGRREMSSDQPFGLWIWAWGSPETQAGTCKPGQAGYSCFVSYGYPAGEGLAALNNIDFPPPE